MTVPKRRAANASNSFPAREVRALACLLKMAREGRDLHAFRRANADVLLALERKAITMLRSIELQESGQRIGARPEGEPSA